MKGHKLVAHVADVRMRVEGSDLTNLFEAALEGMAEIILPDGCKGEMELRETFEISATDTTTLLIEFLSEVLTLTHVNRALFCVVDFEEITETWLRATIRGTRVEEFEEDVKAVTYHEAAVKKNKDGNLETTVVFDI